MAIWLDQPERQIPVLAFLCSLPIGRSKLPEKRPVASVEVYFREASRLRQLPVRVMVALLKVTMYFVRCSQ